MKILNRVKDTKVFSVNDFLGLEFNNLKEEKGRNVNGLRRSIIADGFTFPVFIWAGHNYCIDGKGRKMVVEELTKEGHEFEGIPYVEISADTLEQAKLLVLKASSQYGVITVESFKAHVEDVKVDFDTINIKGIDEVVVSGNGVDDPDAEWNGMPEVNAQRVVGAVRSLIVHFETQEDVDTFAEITDLDISDKTKFTWFPKKDKERIIDTIVENESE
jgi:hypothetical protein